MSDNKFENLLDEAIDNIRKDRTKTNELLGDLVAYVSESKDRHKDVGLTLAKYLEVLQRSNEQLVKLTSVIHKDAAIETELSDEDRKNIFADLNPSLQKKGKK